METFDHEPIKCRVCAYEFSSQGQIQKAAGNPKIRQRVVMCASCMELSIAEDGPFGFILREPTLTELARISEEAGPVLRRFRAFRMNNPPPSSNE